MITYRHTTFSVPLACPLTIFSMKNLKLKIFGSYYLYHVNVSNIVYARICETASYSCAQSLEVSKSSHCLFLYTHSDPSSTPWSSAVVLIWHYSGHVGEREIGKLLRYISAYETSNRLITWLSWEKLCCKKWEFDSGEMWPLICLWNLLWKWK